MPGMEWVEGGRNFIGGGAVDGWGEEVEVV
jgi:hypothetical protein